MLLMLLVKNEAKLKTQSIRTWRTENFWKVSSARLYREHVAEHSTLFFAKNQF